jgi:hypothetical protein
MGVNPAAIIRGVLIFLVTFAAVLAATSASFAGPCRFVWKGTHEVSAGRANGDAGRWLSLPAIR